MSIASSSWRPQRYAPRRSKGLVLRRDRSSRGAARRLDVSPHLLVQGARTAWSAKRSTSSGARSAPQAFSGPRWRLRSRLMAAVSTSQGGVRRIRVGARRRLGRHRRLRVLSRCAGERGERRHRRLDRAAHRQLSSIRGADLTIWLAALLTVACMLRHPHAQRNFRMFAEIVRSRFTIAEKQRAAEDARRAAMTIALTDDLTGLPNRRYFQRPARRQDSGMRTLKALRRSLWASSTSTVSSRSTTFTGIRSETKS